MATRQHPRESDTNGGLQGGPVQESHGRHGGDHGRDQQRNQDAKGSSNRGDRPNAESKNTGGGADTQRERRTQSVPSEKEQAYPNGKQHPSAANDGGDVTDSANRDAR